MDQFQVGGQTIKPVHDVAAAAHRPVQSLPDDPAAALVDEGPATGAGRVVCRAEGRMLNPAPAARTL
jgi:hypothetical protein